MGVFDNIAKSIDDKSSMRVDSVTLLASAIMGVILGLVICFVLIYDVTYDGEVNTELDDLGIFLLCSGAYILGSGVPKAYVDSRLKTRSWVEAEKMRAEAEEDVEDVRFERERRRRQMMDVEKAEEPCGENEDDA